MVGRGFWRWASPGSGDEDPARGATVVGPAGRMGPRAQLGRKRPDVSHTAHPPRFPSDQPRTTPRRLLDNPVRCPRPRHSEGVRSLWGRLDPTHADRHRLRRTECPPSLGHATQEDTKSPIESKSLGQRAHRDRRSQGDGRQHRRTPESRHVLCRRPDRLRRGDALLASRGCGVARSDAEIRPRRLHSGSQTAGVVRSPGGDDRRRKSWSRRGGGRPKPRPWFGSRQERHPAAG